MPASNRFVWDLRHEGATKVRGNKTAGEAAHGTLCAARELSSAPDHWRFGAKRDLYRGQ